MSSFNFDDLIKEGRKRAVKNFEPFGDLIVLEMTEFDRTTGNVLLPQGVADPYFCNLGKVIAAGPKCVQTREGDVVLVPVGTQGWTIIHGPLDDLPGRVLIIREGQMAGVSLIYGRRAEEGVEKTNGQLVSDQRTKSE